MKKALVGLLVLLAGSVEAQISIKGGSGGGGLVTITSGTTATSGCVAGGVLRSISNLVECGAGFTYAAGVATVGSSGIPGTIQMTLDGTAANTFKLFHSSALSAAGVVAIGTTNYMVFGADEASTALRFTVVGGDDPWLLGGNGAETFYMSGGTTDFQFYNKAGTVKKWSIDDGAGMVIGSADISGLIAATVTDVNGQAVKAGVPRLNLTDNTIATFAVQTLGDDTGGGGTLWYTVYAADATTFGVESGTIQFVGGDATAGAGGEVCTTPVKLGTPPQALSGSTLTVTFAASTGTDLCNIRVTADTDIVTPVSLWIKWGVLNSGRTITHQ